MIRAAKKHLLSQGFTPKRVSNAMKLIKHFLYWLRTHTINRYHLVDMRAPQNDYAWGWIDRSEALLYACFALLVDFVEKEKGFDCHIDWNSDDQHREVKATALDLYEWWKHGRAAKKDRVDKLGEAWVPELPEPGKPWNLTGTKEQEAAYVTYSAASDAFDAKDNEQLIRLIKIRGYLWT